MSISENLVLTDCTEPRILSRPTPNHFADLAMPAVSGTALNSVTLTDTTFTPTEMHPSGIPRGAVYRRA